MRKINIGLKLQQSNNSNKDFSTVEKCDDFQGSPIKNELHNIIFKLYILEFLKRV